MPLPSLEKIVPIFDITIPSTQVDIQFRPFLVKEEMLLLMALAGDENSMHEAVSQIVTSCAISPIKVDTLANFDLEYAFLQLRIRSVNEFVDLTYRCRNEVALSTQEIESRMKMSPRFKVEVESLPEGSPVLGKCENTVKIRLDLRTVEIQNNPNHSKKIFLTDTIGMTMKYPNIAVSRMLNKPIPEGQEVKTDIANTIKVVAMCVESVFDDQSVYTNFTVKDMEEWVGKLTQPQFLKIQEFFETMPKLAYDLDFHCPKCNYHQTIPLVGLTSFFV